MVLLTDRVYDNNESYEDLEEKYGIGHNRICINSCVTGCGNCVGYCRYQGHPGFLTESLRSEHQCLNKDCAYYVARPAPVRKLKMVPDNTDQAVLSSARVAVSDMEGLRIMRAVHNGTEWLLKYVTISNEYVLEPVAKVISKSCNMPVRFERLNYSFDLCMQLILEA